MAQPIQVIPARPEHLERSRALRLAALSDAPDAFTSTLAQERDQPPAFWRERLGRPRTTTLLAMTAIEGAERDVGLAVVAPYDEKLEVAGLYSVWVAPEARGKGVGDALMKAAIAQARAFGFRRLVLDVGDYNTTAIQLYARHGFAPTGRTSTLPA